MNVWLDRIGNLSMIVKKKGNQLAKGLGHFLAIARKLIVCDGCTFYQRKEHCFYPFFGS